MIAPYHSPSVLSSGKEFEQKFTKITKKKESFTAKGGNNNPFADFAGFLFKILKAFDHRGQAESPTEVTCALQTTAATGGGGDILRPRHRSPDENAGKNRAGH